MALPTDSHSQIVTGNISAPEVPPHWTYFLCLEEDIVRLSRWIEFAEANFGCYSIEIARLLMAACAEVDVVAKLVCKSIDPKSKANGIGEYQETIVAAFPSLPLGTASIPRHGIRLRPWENWDRPKSSPGWWTAYNKVKHHRTEHFPKASLQHLLNATAGLLILLTLLHRGKLEALNPPTQLFRPEAFLTRFYTGKILFSMEAQG